MTCIVGFIDRSNGCVIIGADSAGSAGSAIRNRKDTKVFKVKDFVIGCTSSFRMIQLIRFSFNPPDIGEKDVYQYMCTDFISALRTCFKYGGFLKTDSSVDSGGTFLVAIKDRLFQVENDFQVAELYDNFNAVGCGDDYAFGAMAILEDLVDSGEISASDAVLKSLEVSARFSSGVREPFNLISTYCW